MTASVTHDASQQITEEFEPFSFLHLLLQDSGSKPNLTPRVWMTLLFRAISEDEFNVFRELVEWVDRKATPSSEFNVNRPWEESPNQSTCLHKACALNRREMVAYLLQRHDIEVNARDGFQSTPLHYAASNGSVDCVVLLLGKGRGFVRKVRFQQYIEEEQTIAVDWKDSYGNTPIHLALKHRHYEVVSILLDFNPNLVNSRKSNSRSCLHMAVENFDLEGCKLLTRRQDGTKVHCMQKDENGLTPLMLVVQEFTQETSSVVVGKYEKLAIFMYLMCLGDHSTLLNKHIDYHGRNILHLACINDSVDIVRLIALHVEKDIYLKMMCYKDRHGHIPLHTACKYGAQQVLNTFLLMLDDPLIQQECLIMKDRDGNTPLHLAAKSLLSIVKRNSTDVDALQERVESRYISCIETLFSLVDLDIENNKHCSILRLLKATNFFENSTIFTSSFVSR